MLHEQREQRIDPRIIAEIKQIGLLCALVGIAAFRVRHQHRDLRQLLHKDPVIAERPKKSDEERRQALDWCGKMLARTQRDDAEGAYRWHWLLIDSLEIYFDLHGLPYYGPKKALRTMEQTDPEAFSLYSKALNSMNRDALSAWIACLQPGI